MVADHEIAACYEQHGFLLYRRCLRILGSPDDALDALQEVFCQAVRYRTTFRREAPPLHWLQRLTTHHCLRRLRKARQQERLHEALRRDGLCGNVDPAGGVASRDLLRKLFDRYDERTQAVLVTIHVEGLKQEEAAEVLGISARAVRKRLRAARALAERITRRTS